MRDERPGGVALGEGEGFFFFLRLGFFVFFSKYAKLPPLCVC